MRARVVSTAIVVAGLGIATMTLAQPVRCCLGYSQIFASAVGQLTAARRSDIGGIQHRDSDSKLDSIKRAKAVMPPGHWATRSDLKFRYYNAEQGYWMYAQELEQVTEESGIRYDGKRIRLSPFVAISNSRDGKKTYVITADRAVIDLNQPLGFGAGPDGETLKVKHIRLEPNVEICDNKGTPDKPSDDMKIGPLRDLEYDDITPKITTESHVKIGTLLSEIAKRRAELELLQLEYDVDAAFLKRAMADVRQFDAIAAFFAVELEAAKRKAAVGLRPPTSKEEQPKQDSAQGNDITVSDYGCVKFESLHGFPMDEEMVKRYRAALDLKKKELVQRGTALNQKRLELAEFETKNVAAK
jgi:hypothetical protein